MVDVGAGDAARAKRGVVGMRLARLAIAVFALKSGNGIGAIATLNTSMPSQGDAKIPVRCAARALFVWRE